ncbi:MAG: hypothetical protein GEV03_04830 [Streptosporangiales bacterium]|nr:hypothetical protein [Streptosporangiales bacterium]
MFDKFTDRARRVVLLAREESVHLNHDYLGTEHLLLGLLRQDEGVAAEILADMDIRLEEMRRRVEEIIGGREDQSRQEPSESISFTPRAKNILEMSLVEARDLGQRYIDTEHLLLALVREGEGVAAVMLAERDVDLDRVRREVAGRRGNPPQS